MNDASAADRPTAPRGRGRPARAVERMLDAAVQIVDEQGADALSMRSLAQRLGSGTATLYRHFANRSELVSMVIDHILGAAEEVTPGPRWQDACMALAQNLFGALRRHGNVAPLLVEYTPIGPNALAHRERCLSVLLANGFDRATAAHAYATLARYVLGFALQSGPTAGERDGELAAAFHRLDATRYPATVAVADELPVPLTEEFGFGLRLIVAGLERLRD